MFTIKTKFVSGIVAFSLFASSFGGVFSATALASSPDQVANQDTVTSEKADPGILAGLVAVGLIASMSNHGSSSKASSPSKSTDGGTQTPTTSTSAADEQQALSLLNQDRAKNGLPALKANTQLTALARNYAQDMIKRGYFSHNNPEGQSPFDRLNKAGISYKSAGENLGIDTSVPGAETAFMNSSGHRANILNSGYTEAGVGVVRTSNGQVYVVQEFIGK